LDKGWPIFQEVQRIEGIWFCDEQFEVVQGDAPEIGNYKENFL